MEKRLLKLFLNMYGVSSTIAARLFDAGFDDIQKLKNASVDEMVLVRGVDRQTVAMIRNALLKMGMEPGKFKDDICICSDCGAFVLASAKHCDMCGAEMDDYSG